MIDTHCHLQTEAFEADREAVISQALASGVVSVVVPAIDQKSLEPTLDIANHHEGIFCALGIHPHHATEWNNEVRDWILNAQSGSKKVVAIGEIGLDYHYDFCPQGVQRSVFAEQMELAQSLKLPIVVHTRESDEDVLKIIEDHYQTDRDGSAGQLHCFSGTVGTMQRGIDRGFYVSFTGNITFKKSALGEVVEMAPLDRILLETDSPYMTPVPFRGKRNTPEYLHLVAEKIAEIKKLDIGLVIKETTANARRLFSLPLLTLVLGVILSIAPSSLFAQRTEPVGSAPPDSVMNDDRRKAEEQIRLQREELRKEATKRTQDSLLQVQKQQQEEQAKAEELIRQDSIKAAERILGAERDSLRAKTPIAWKAIGIGGAIGVGNMALIQSKPSITPTSVLATSLYIGTQLSRTLDFQFSWMNMRVGDDLVGLYNSGNGSPTGPMALKQKITLGSHLPYREDLYITDLAFDFRLAFNPRNAFKFYAGLGYNYLIIENKQNYHFNTNDTIAQGVPSAASSTSDIKYYRSALDILFGVREDLEYGTQFIITPFAEISALAAFQGQTQALHFVFRPDADLITMTHVRVGVEVNWGWFGVERYH
jgi:TatD DNase family protein